MNPEKRGWAGENSLGCKWRSDREISYAVFNIALEMTSGDGQICKKNVDSRYHLTLNSVIC